MGPRLFSRGNTTLQHRYLLLILASMGPRLFSRGNIADTDAVLETGVVASMGPRLFSRGNSMKASMEDRPDFSLQWGHDFSAVEIVMEMTMEARDIIMASMGPRLFSRGNATSAAYWCGLIGLLQWGHDFSAVEMRIGLWEVIRGSRCFNGATTFQPWKCSRMRVSIDRMADGLQWGHDFSAVEMTVIISSQADRSSLQWGHDFSAVEIPHGPNNGHRRIHASMGPRLFSRGNFRLRI